MGLSRKSLTWISIGALVVSMVGCMQIASQLAFPVGVLATPPYPQYVDSNIQLGNLEEFNAAKNKLPLKSEFTTRLFIYCPDSFRDISDSPIIIVNGVWTGNKENPSFKNMFVPEAVFVVDVEQENIEVWLFQRLGFFHSYKEEVGNKLALSKTGHDELFIKVRKHVTSFSLVQVSEIDARPVIGSLKYSGYISIQSD